MNRFLLSLVFVFGLISFAHAENETVTVKIFTGSAKCDSADIYSCGGFKTTMGEDAVIELKRDEDSSDDDQSLSGTWSKEFTDEQLTYSATITVEKNVSTVEGKTYTHYLMIAYTGPTEETQGSVGLVNTSLSPLLANQTSVISAPLSKDGSVFRSILTFGNLSLAGGESSEKIINKSFRK